jgi:hypothetical protein
MVIDTLAPQYIAPPILQAVFFFFFAHFNFLSEYVTGKAVLFA